jgi:hypothetical protein
LGNRSYPYSSPYNCYAPIASAAFDRIAELYVIEAQIRGRTADKRRAVREEKSGPIADQSETLVVRHSRGAVF